MVLIIHEKFLNKDFISVFLELNKDLIDSLEQLENGDLRCCLKPLSEYLPPFFIRVSLKKEEGSIGVANTPDLSLKGYLQLNVVPCVFTYRQDGTSFVVDGELTFSNDFPQLVKRVVAKTKKNMEARLSHFFASL